MFPQPRPPAREETVLVTGATGVIGRALVGALLAAGAEVRAVTRDPWTAALPRDVEVVCGNPNAPHTLATALKDATALFVHPAAAGESTSALLRLARERGVRRAVLLSSADVADQAAQEADPLVFWHRLLEEAVASSGLRWRVLRCAELAADALTRWAPAVRATGEIHGPDPLTAAAPIHEQDVAAAATALLMSDAHADAVHTLTGPESLTRPEIARVLAEVLERPVRFRTVPRDQAVRELVAWRGLPEGLAEAMVSVSHRDRPGARVAPVTDAVERLTGRPALPFARWVADHAAAFR
jgi:uncharacterized protein YbjT (DUF2867 family)